ncbi:MAG: hypothetical protein QGE95_13435, partial [Arenicellales bacterium]|nr:hypothetical protein [Arenicellales bacterium]
MCLKITVWHRHSGLRDGLNYLTDASIDRASDDLAAEPLRTIAPQSFREVEVSHKDGSTRLLEISEVPVLDNAGHSIGEEGIAHD